MSATGQMPGLIPVDTIGQHISDPMEPSTTKLLRIGAWRVNPTRGEIARDGETARLEARTMRLLLCLAEHAGEVVSIDDLLSEVWAGVIVTPDSVYQAVASLRRLLGDDPKQPAYIATVPRLGYRMVAMVSPWSEDEPAASTMKEAGGASSRTRRLRASGTTLALAVVVVAVVAGLLAYLTYERVALRRSTVPAAVAALPEKSVAVVPFLDLTPGMKEEEFADGITEEIIDKLSRIPGLRVPSATASFFFKGKRVSVAEMAKTLSVAYVLDGSVRKSGTWIRVDARLTRADNGYVVWSETYDQPMKNILMVQDDIAGAVAKALRASLGSESK
ncbi:MAG: winged helix-turn-helix domain-containing protein [Acidobacteriaceae bacterium]